MRVLFSTLTVALLAACSADAPPASTEAAAMLEPDTPPMAREQESPAGQRLTAVLGAQSASAKARYPARHPKETLMFFGLRPGMTVVEAIPEGGWYSRILHPFLGPEGRLIGADYALDMYPMFEYYSDAELADKGTWTARWPEEVATWVPAGAPAAAFNFGSMPEELGNSADAVLFIRALHNLAVFESRGGYLSGALADAYRVLKPGGIVGVVQHMGPESHSDAWASGENGYLHKSAVIAAFEAAGFVLDGESSVNENPLDQPSESEYVWRLPPTLEEADSPELRARYTAIGESNRMTLRFKKPLAGQRLRSKQQQSTSD